METLWHTRKNFKILAKLRHFVQCAKLKTAQKLVPLLVCLLLWILLSALMYKILPAAVRWKANQALLCTGWKAALAQVLMTLYLLLTIVLLAIFLTWLQLKW